MMVSCEEDRLAPLPEPVPLTMTADAASVVMGEEFALVFSVSEQDAVLNEDIDIRLSAVEGEEDASDLFTSFPASVVMKKGESVMKVPFMVKETGISGHHSIDLSAFSRGYRIAGTPVSVVVSDHHYVTVAVRNNPEGVVSEGESFVLTASVGRASDEDIAVSIVSEEGEGYLVNLPEVLTIPAGSLSVESGQITMVSDGGMYQSVSVTLSLSCQSEEYPLAGDVLTIVRKDVDEPLGTALADERHLYPTPSTAFVSSSNKGAVQTWGGQNYVEVTPGTTAHPTLSGWMFHNAVEFHYIQSVLYNGFTLGEQHSSGGQDRPHSFADQSTAKAGQYMTVDNNRYSAVMPSGYLRMWAAKDATLAKGYGVAAFYSNKFKDPSGANGNTNKPAYCHILPGMRIEFRMRVGGELNGFNPAIWLMGNSNIQNTAAVSWPACGEIDVVEIPVGKVTGKSPLQTLHFGNAAQDGTDVYSPSSGSMTGIDPSVWNIYWVEWSDESTVRLGVNGSTNITVTRAEVESHGGVWPFDMTANPYGLHLVLTLGYPAPSAWALGFTDDPPAGWDSGFSSLTYSASRSDERTPRMEVDWIRYYVSSSYPKTLPSAYNTSKFY